MRRRDFIAAFAGSAAAWPLTARAQENRVYRVGYLSLGSPATEASRFSAFREGLAALGYIEGKNLLIEQRWLDGRPYEQLTALAAELVDQKVDVIVTYSTPGVSAAKRATTIIPIIFLTIGDAVAVGVVSSLARPAGNATGVSYFNPELTSKRLELLKEAIPGLAQAAVLFNPENAATQPVLSALRSTARSLQLTLSEFAIPTPANQEPTFAAMLDKRVGGFVVTEDPTLIYNTEATASLALKFRLPGCGFSEFAKAGGLLAYGIDFVEMFRYGATLVDKILKGARPADIPVEQATKFVTLINLKAAKTIGVAVPPTLLARADEVIE